MHPPLYLAAVGIAVFALTRLAHTWLRSRSKLPTRLTLLLRWGGLAALLILEAAAFAWALIDASAADGGR